MIPRFDTRDNKPRLRALLLLSLLAAAGAGTLMLLDAERFAVPICLITVAYSFGAILVLLWAFREQIKYNPYSYNTIIYMGFALFALSVMITHIVLAVRMLRMPGVFAGTAVVHTLLGSAKNYMLLSTPFLVVFSAALCISNISLIRHEGKRTVNFLGILLSFLLLAGDAFLFLFDFSASGSQQEVMVHDLIVNLFAAIYLYCICSVSCHFEAIHRREIRIIYAKRNGFLTSFEMTDGATE